MMRFNLRHGEERSHLYSCKSNMRKFVSLITALRFAYQIVIKGDSLDWFTKSSQVIIQIR